MSEAINSLGSCFFATTVSFCNEAEAVYAADLWHSFRRGLTVRFYASEESMSIRQEIEYRTRKI